VSALLLQMLHPAALAGVWDHSAFRHDMLGRLRRTARFIAVTTYADRALADAAIDKVRAVHEHVAAYCPMVRPIAPTIRICSPGFTCAKRSAFSMRGSPMASRHVARRSGCLHAAGGAGGAPAGRRSGARDAAQADALIVTFRSELRADARTRQVAWMVLSQPAPSLAAAPAQHLLFQAAVDLMPAWAQALHGRRLPLPATPLVRGGAMAMARTLQWAFAPARRDPPPQG
jgi:uncharacterized protein (DUF2236 family)